MKVSRSSGKTALKRQITPDQHHKNRTDEELEKLVISFSLENPHLGQVQIQSQLKVNYAVEISTNGVRYVWLRKNMNISALKVQLPQSLQV